MGRKITAKSRKSTKRKQCEGSVTPGQCAKQFLHGLKQSSASDDLDFEDDDVIEEVEEEVVDGDCMEDGSDTEGGNVTKCVWDPRLHQLGEGEELQVDNSAYTAYHSLRVEWPSLTFDIIRDQLGAVRVKPPYQLIIAAGTQAERHDQNKVGIWRVANLCSTQHDDDSSSDADENDEDEDMEDDDGQPVITARDFSHPGAVNRLRSCPQNPNLLATWSDNSSVYIWDAKDHIDSLDNGPQQLDSTLSPLFEFSGHTDQGYALDWSPAVAGRLATGCCSKSVYVWDPRESTWEVQKSPFKGHRASVEDIQWSPSEQGVFASCSVDKSIRIWDTRSSAKAMLVVENAHDIDVNVISWNQSVAHLLASGSDDGSFKIWDLRQFQSGRAAGFFRWHEKPVTAIQWHPTQDSVLAVTSEDDSCTIWDMSVELDREELQQAKGAGGADLGNLDIPPQLVFVHRGQTQIKDVRFHPQIPSLLATTAFDGFNFFKPDNLEAV